MCKMSLSYKTEFLVAPHLNTEIFLYLSKHQTNSFVLFFLFLFFKHTCKLGSNYDMKFLNQKTLFSQNSWPGGQWSWLPAWWREEYVIRLYPIRKWCMRMEQPTIFVTWTSALFILDQHRPKSSALLLKYHQHFTKFWYKKKITALLRRSCSVSVSDVTGHLSS